ncbi:D-alanyl-D-alanine dipeptidase [Acetobacteraceae bacterium H6797]|nr:D-alanyl-D-alanine dipeptidase [Acetobacteraceae bacterium H6797]
MLVTLTEADGFTIDLRYATADNLSGTPIFSRAVAMLVPEARDKLFHARDLAARLGYRFRLFDCYRPVEAQWVLWNAVTDKRFVSDPRLGGLHPRGVAVDLTLIDEASSQDLDMGTGFDAVTPDSAHGSTNVSKEAQRNRALLLGLMTTAGWDHYSLEWWHYQLFEPRRYPSLWASAVKNGPM